MESRIPDMHWTVADTCTRFPEAVSVFNRFGMACAGCTMAPFETLSEAADAYGLDVRTLLTEVSGVTRLREAGSQSPSEAN